MAHIGLLEPYYTGSHATWLDEFVKHTSHTISSYTLDGRFWKWRMHGGAVSLAKQVVESDTQIDLFLATDMLDLTTFQALTRKKTSNIPCAIYFHENQLTYPPRPGEKRDLHYGFINYSSALAADKVFFNSQFHMEAFLDELPRLLKHFPDYNELWTVDAIAEKSVVLPLGMDLQAFDHYRLDAKHEGPLRILWNHRWEYDKQPSVFFDALYALQDEELDFEVIVLGESFRQKPEEFLEAQERLGDRLSHIGYTKSFSEYAQHLWGADVQVSCAIQDFFGGSTCVAIYCDCLPILPKRLNYPAFIPDDYHKECLYADPEGLFERLRWACLHPEEVRELSLRQHVERYDWNNIISHYDEALLEIIKQAT